MTDEQIYDDWQLEKLKEIEPFDLQIRKRDVICDQCIVGYNIVFQHDGTRAGFTREYDRWIARGYLRDPQWQVRGVARYD